MLNSTVATDGIGIVGDCGVEIRVHLVRAIGRLINVPALDLVIHDLFLGDSLGFHLELVLDDLVEIFDGEEICRRERNTIVSDHGPEKSSQLRIANDLFTI